MSLIISFDVKVRCNSRWEIVNEKGVQSCRETLTETHHLQPEHYESKIESLTISIYTIAIGEGWTKDGDEIYCPKCSLLNDDFPQDLSPESVSIN